MENHEFPKAGHILAMHDERVTVAFIECVVCGSQTSTRDEGESDAELTREFEDRGWTVSPTRCPKHVGQTDK